MLRTKLSKPRHNNYIGSIDGLRAIAVALVLFFHAGFTWAQGGFIGVDVFFVISGFLITGQILKAHNSNSWSYASFYGRRILRLFPPLFVTIILTQLVAAFVMSPGDIDRLSESSIAAVLFVPNIYFWLESGYFTQGAETKPLLHTWSLGVEEQFYIIWPVLIGYTLTIGRRLLTPVIVILGMAAFCALLFFHRTYADAVFFLTPFRAFQFATGAILALSGIELSNLSAKAAGAVSVIGMFVLMIALNGGSSPVIAMTMPTILTALFIASARDRKNTIVFASSPMAWLGKRSYSIYLAHWPIMVFWRILSEYTMSPIEGGLSIALSIVIGALLHKYVENPLRLKSRERLADHKQRLSVVGGLALSIIGASFFLQQASVWKRSNHQTIASTVANAEISHVATEKPNEKTGTCYLQKHNDISDYAYAKCNPFSGAKPAYIMLGDSYAGDVTYAVSKAYKDVDLGQFIVPGCGLRTPSESANNDSSHCDRFYRYAYEEVIPSLKLDGVFLTANWMYVSDQEIMETINHFHTHNLKVFVIGLRPLFAERVPSVVEQKGSVDAAAAVLSKTEDLSRRERNREMRKNFANTVPIIDIYDYFCDETCEISTDTDQLIFRDQSHLTLQGAAWLSRKIASDYPLARLSSSAHNNSQTD